MTRVYPEKSLRFLLSDPFWWQNRISSRNDDVLPSAKKPYGRNERKTPTRASETREAHS